jgi:hypothetical protein
MKAGVAGVLAPLLTAALAASAGAAPNDAQQKAHPCAASAPRRKLAPPVARLAVSR